MGTEEEKNAVRKLILLLVGPLVAYLIFGIALDLYCSSTSSEKTKADSSFVSSSSSRVASSKASSSSSRAESSRASSSSSRAESSRASSSSSRAESSRVSNSSSSADLSKVSSSGRGGSTVQYDNPITENCDYVLNTSTKKFHYSWCSSARKIKESNQKLFNGSRDDVTAMGYEPCKRCNP